LSLKTSGETVTADFRRRHTKNFTTIGNELFDDERLAADEVGILAYLLSRPHNWEIRRPALQRRWKLGRDGMRRIIRSWLRTGWLRAEKIRMKESGTFKIIYNVCDDPGPELSDDDVTKVLSLVSSEPVDASEDANEDESQPAPVTSQPPVAQPPPANPPLAYIENLTKTDSTKTESTKSSGAVFDDICSSWPPSEVLSRVRSEQLFVALAPEDRELATAGASVYLSNCRSKNRKVCDLSTYLRERRWETVKAPRPTGFVVRPGTPQAARWLDFFTNAGGHAFEVSQLLSGRPITTPTEWPPAMPYALSPSVRSDTG
jgi:hypothetical protein